jgi:hypothetical protein
MVQAILADANIQGHLQALLTVLEGPFWREVWASLALPLFTFRDLGLAVDAADATVWQICQQRQVILITANRNAAGPDSLEATIRTCNTATSLPVFTLADPGQVLRSRDYAERVAERLLEYLIDIDNYRGTGRLYLP